MTWGTQARTSRGLRGGPWNNNENNLRSSNRNNNDATNENNNIGFRVASLWTEVCRKAPLASPKLVIGKAG